MNTEYSEDGYSSGWISGCECFKITCDITCNVQLQTLVVTVYDF
jgi:hypothetical protein